MGPNTITHKTFIFDSFLEQLAENTRNIFKKSGQRNWLKIDLVTAKDDWQYLFKDYGITKRGEIYYFKMPASDHDVEYCVYEIKKGLLMFFSLSKREEYDSTLKPFIKRTHGMTNTWFPFTSFETTINFIKSHYSSKICSFTARRPLSSKYPAKIRNDTSRIIRYSGDDADHSLNELRAIYGVLPTTIDFQIESDKIRITNDGFILVQNINLKILRIIEEVVDQAITEPIRLRDVSRQVSYEPKTRWNNFKISKLMSGKIVFRTDLNVPTIHQLFYSFNDDSINQTGDDMELPKFSFINTNISKDPFHYSATVIDEYKGTVFGISGNSSGLTLVPKHKTTFESFIDFYRLINESIDESSNLYLFNESYGK